MNVRGLTPILNVSDIEASFQWFEAIGWKRLCRGAQGSRGDEPWGVREFHLRHPDGHTFRIGAGLLEA